MRGRVKGWKWGWSEGGRGDEVRVGEGVEGM